MIAVRLMSVGLVVSVLTGCAEKNIPLDESFWDNQKQKIAVTSVAAPKPELFPVGSVGLLDRAIIALATHKFNGYLASTDVSWVYKMPKKFSDALVKHHILADNYKTLPGKQKNQYAEFSDQTGHNKVLVMKLNAAGARREYHGFIPLTAPIAYCSLTGELLDPAHHKVLWRYKSEIEQPVNGKWDQPPRYPNFTRALKRAEKIAQMEVLDSLFSGR